MLKIKNTRNGYTYEVRKLVDGKFALYRSSAYAFEAFEVLSVGSESYILTKFNKLKG
jgi:hypothetical protein